MYQTRFQCLTRALNQARTKGEIRDRVALAGFLLGKRFVTIYLNVQRLDHQAMELSPQTAKQLASEFLDGHHRGFVPS
jgi:hypothetical protein